MTASSPSSVRSWVLEIAVTAAPATDARWHRQLDQIRPLATYQPATRTWCTLIGALDLVGIGVLQSLFDVSHAFGTQVRLTPVAAPAQWSGPVFTGDTEIVTLLNTDTDHGRALGHLPMA
ncbi:hypothetical protein [Streptomyces sp. NPDC004230]